MPTVRKYPGLTDSPGRIVGDRVVLATLRDRVPTHARAVSHRHVDSQSRRFDAGYGSGALENLVEERQAGWRRHTSRRINADSQGTARVKAGIDIEQLHKAAQEQSTGDSENDDNGHLRGERQPLHVHAAPIYRDSGVRSQPVHEVSRSQVQQGDAAEDEA